MNIRPVTDADFPRLSGIYTDAYNVLKIGEEWTPPTAEKLLRHLYDAQPDLFFVIEMDGVVGGAVNALVKPWWDGNHITDGEIFVDPKQQGKGIGKALLKHLFVQAKQLYQAVAWDTFTHVVHEHPLSWYKELGFEEIKEWTMITGDIEKVLDNLEKK